MGCDIHLWVEKRAAAGAWEVVPGPNPWLAKSEECLRDARQIDSSNPRRAGLISFWEGESKAAQGHPIVRDGSWLWDGRRYDLFAILADVRNGYGFAGIPTGDGFNPISQPRGIPRDVTNEVRADYDEYGSDAHSASYHSLRHLEEYDWGQTTMVRQRVEVPIGDGGVKISGFSDNETRVVPVTYAQAAGSFYEEALPKLRELANGDPESVRIVFWFDN